MPFFRLGPTTRLDDTKIMAICQRGKIVGEGTPSWLVRACRRGLDQIQNATHALCSDGHKVIIITIVISLLHLIISPFSLPLGFRFHP